MQIGTTQKKTEYSGIDLCKLISAILIVLLHATETNDIYAVGIQYVFTRFCVPFFFICSGFFFYSGIQRAADSKAYFLNYEKRLLLLFLFYGVIVSAPIVITDYINNNPDASIYRLILLIVRRMFVIGNGAYWYLVALIISAAILYVCYIRHWNKVLIGAIIVGLILNIGYTSFQGIISGIPVWKKLNDIIYFVFSWEANFLMYGVPFFGLGWLINKYSIMISKTTAWISLVLLTVLRFLEYCIPYINSFWQANSFSISFIPQAVMFFFVAYHCKGYPKYAKGMRQLSTFIYFTHWILLYNILNPIMLNVLCIDVYNPMLIPLKVVVTLVVCYVLNWILKKTNKKMITFLIGG